MRELGADCNIVQVVRHKLPVEVALLVWYPALRSLALQPSQSLLDFILTPLTLVLSDYALAFLVEFLLSVAEVNRNLLVVVADLLAQVARTRMYYEIYVPAFTPVEFDEVVAPAERAYAPQYAPCIFKFPIAFQLFELLEVNCLALVDSHSRRYFEPYEIIECFEVNIDLAEIDAEHPTRNINAYSIRHYLVRICRCKADYTSLASVGVGHYAHGFILICWVVNQ